MNTIVIIDYGSQYTQLIARRIRELHVYAEILPSTRVAGRSFGPEVKGVILSGGPNSVYDPGAPGLSPEILSLGRPVLGICYGMQLINQSLGGTVGPGAAREYGRSDIRITERAGLFQSVPERTTVWMSHGDHVKELAPGFKKIASSEWCEIAAFQHEERPIYGVQFHPEVGHTVHGREMIAEFLFAICGAKAEWTMDRFRSEAHRSVLATVGPSDRVIMALSGGVDSTVVATLLYEILRDRVSMLFVDNGLLRLNEAEHVMSIYRDHLKLPVQLISARDRFLSALHSVVDPEEKRRRIGRVFVEIFEEHARALSHVKFLAQGTLYPDVVESISAFGGPSQTIKTHHNVGGLPERMNLKLIEPVRELFKDEVRELGRALSIPNEILNRHPFPGPGLAVRILGAVNHEDLELVRKADWILIDELRRANLYSAIWQAFAVLLPIQTVGVMGDQRSYDRVIALRAITSVDGMTAEWYPFSPELLRIISNRITNEVRGINRVVYDITSKPPATIEWE